jgi:hypothetical protein
MRVPGGGLTYRLREGIMPCPWEASKKRETELT